MLQQLWLRRLTSVLRQSSRSNRQARHARIEALEIRLCPSTFTAVNTIPTVSFSSPNAVAVGDFNEDGNQDVVTANANRTYGKDVSVFLGDGTGDFGAPTSFGLGTNPAISVAVGDFNGDHHQDIVFGRGDNVFGSHDGADLTTLLLGNGDGTFATPLLVAAGLNPTSIAVGDFNGDANLDLAVANYDAPHFGSPNVSILLGNGDGAFGPRTVYAVGYTAFAVAVGDFNADHIQDLAVTDPADNKISLLLGNGTAGSGNGTFQAPVRYAGGVDIYLPNSVAIGDFNEDGKQDVAVAYTFASKVAVHEGNGNGTLKPAVLFSVGGKPTSVAVGDFNGDGHQDLVTSNHEASWTSNHGASVLVGTGATGSIGSGSFLPAEVYAVGDLPQAVAVGDFNNDGAADAAVANTYSHTVSILFGASIANVDPVIDSLSATSVSENGVSHLTGTYHDVGTQGHTLSINWGDGVLETVVVSGGSFDITHQYLDDPSGTGSDVFTIGVTLTDDEDGSTSSSTSITVTNLAPTATNNTYGTAQGVAVSGNVISDALADSDPAGASDALTVTSFTQPANGSVTVAADGSFTYIPTTIFSGTDSFTYSISDGDGGTSTATVSVIVVPAAAGSVTTVIDTCEGGTALLINGTNAGDKIIVEFATTPGSLRITINATIAIVATPSGRIIVLGDAGDDNIQIAGGILNSVWAYGDAGHDRIFGGGGASLLIGGDGNDQLTGGSGRDILIGGQGADKLVGNSNDDVLIAGYTTKDDRMIYGVEEFWCQVMQEWNSTNSFADRLANLRGAGTQKAIAHNGTSYLLPVVNDDTSADEIDKLQGSSGNDWFIYRAGEDKVVGQIEAAN